MERIRVVHDGVGEHVGELAVELAAVDDAAGRDEILSAGKPDVAGARVAIGQGGGGLGGGPVAVVDGGADALEVLRMLDHLMIARRILLADGRGKHVRGPVVDDLLHGGPADLIEGPGPQNVLGPFRRRRAFRRPVARSARRRRLRRGRGEVFPLALGGPRRLRSASHALIGRGVARFRRRPRSCHFVFDPGWLPFACPLRHLRSLVARGLASRRRRRTSLGRRDGGGALASSLPRRRSARPALSRGGCLAALRFRFLARFLPCLRSGRVRCGGLQDGASRLKGRARDVVISEPELGTLPRGRRSRGRPPLRAAPYRKSRREGGGRGLRGARDRAKPDGRGRRHDRRLAGMDAVNSRKPRRLIGRVVHS